MCKMQGSLVWISVEFIVIWLIWSWKKETFIPSPFTDGEKLKRKAFQFSWEGAGRTVLIFHLPFWRRSYIDFYDNPPCFHSLALVLHILSPVTKLNCQWTNTNERREVRLNYPWMERICIHGREPGDLKYSFLIKAGISIGLGCP